MLCAAGHLFVRSSWALTLPSQGGDVGAATTGGQWGWEGLCIAERNATAVVGSGMYILRISVSYLRK